MNVRRRVMSSTAVSRVVAVASLALTIVGASTVWAAKPMTEAAPVALLYKDFAWQAFSGQSELFGEDISHQSKAVLAKYFSLELAELLFREAACQARSGGICNLDFDLLFDSQDPRITDLDVEAKAPGKVTVEFKDPVNEEKTQIEFAVARVAGKWKITDIFYRMKAEPSLKKILLRKTP